MKNYNVYHHVKLNKYEVVKNGYNFPAFFFGVLWMLYSRLWFHGLMYVMIFFTTIILLDVAYVSYYTDVKLTDPLLDIFLFVAGLWIGSKGNEWKRDRLVKHGYDLVGGSINAHNTDDAISKIGS